MWFGTGLLGGTISVKPPTDNVERFLFRFDSKKGKSKGEYRNYSKVSMVFLEILVRVSLGHILFKKLPTDYLERGVHKAKHLG